MSGRTSSNRRGGGAVEKPWASGRILTPEQRARKQEADRKANRFLKKEVQDRLSLLEARVLELEKSGPQDESGAELGSKDSIQNGNSAPGQNGADVQFHDRGADWNATVPFQGTSVSSEHSQVEILESPAITIPGEGYFSNADAISHPGPGAYGNSNANAVVTNPVPARGAIEPADFTDVTTSARTRPDGRHLTCFLNNLVNYIRTMTPAVVCFDDHFNQDLIVTAVMKGWDETLSRYQQKCPLWDVLRLVDLYLFKDCNFVERVSCLRMLHKRYLFEVNANLPTAGPPPPWFRPQFSEKVFFHDPVIDHLTWPRLRERLIASEQDRLTNKFWLLFVKNLRVTWRYEPIDIMTYSAATQLYQLTPVYEAALLDMSTWRMDMDFFRGIPQLAGDVPPYNYMPLRTVAPKFGTNANHEGPTLSPRFGLQSAGQDQQQAEDQVPENAWIQHQPTFPDAAQLGVMKMSPGNSVVWQDFYS